MYENCKLKDVRKQIETFILLEFFPSTSDSFIKYIYAYRLQTTTHTHTHTHTYTHTHSDSHTHTHTQIL